MVPFPRSIGTAVFGTSGSLTVTQPAGRVAGDLLLLFIGCDANASVTPTASTNAPWTLYDGVVTSSGTTRAVCKVYSLISSGVSDASATVTATPTGSTACHQSAVIIAFGNIASGATVATALEAAVNDDQTGAANTTSFTVTTTLGTTGNRLVVGCSMFGSNTASGCVFGSGYTQQVFTDDATGISGALYVGTLEVAGTTSVATSVTFTGGSAAGLSSIAAKVIGGPDLAVPFFGFFGPTAIIYEE